MQTLSVKLVKKIFLIFANNLHNLTLAMFGCKNTTLFQATVKYIFIEKGFSKFAHGGWVKTDDDKIRVIKPIILK